jgi:hypothetical protein
MEAVVLRTTFSARVFQLEYFRSEKYSPRVLRGLIFGNFRGYSGAVQDCNLLTDGDSAYNPNTMVTQVLHEPPKERVLFSLLSKFQMKETIYHLSFFHLNCPCYWEWPVPEHAACC